MWRCNSSVGGSYAGNRSGGFRSSCLCDGAQREPLHSAASLAQIEPAARDQLFGRALSTLQRRGWILRFLIALAA